MNFPLPEKVIPPQPYKKVLVYTVPNGPFKGRHYIKNPDGTLGRRVKEEEITKLEPINA